MSVTARSILERGYLPKELPACFTSRAFAKAADSLAAVPPERESTRATGLSLARPGGLRRRLAITNPFSQLHVARRFAAGWPELEKHFAQSQIGLSRPIEGRLRAFQPKTRFSDQIGPRLTRMNRARFLLSTDISEFYPSVYTHSLSWALEGKAAAKQRFALGRRQTQTLGDWLDRAIRNGQEGQTKGLPIGPDSSFLAAEIVMSAIDAAVQKRFPRFPRSAMRFYDDLEYFAATRTEAEEALVAWESELARYELTLNADKTRITEAPISLQAPWFTALAAIRIRTTSETTTANDIISYFDKAFELARQHPKDSVISYAIQRFRKWPFTVTSWRTYARLLLPAVIAEPSSLPHVAYAFARARSAALPISRSRLQETLNDLVRHHAALSHGAEVLWSLWILAESDATLEAEAVKAVAAMEDNPCLLVLLYLRRRRLVDATADLSLVLQRAEAAGAITSGDWLLAYEATRQKWVSNPSIRRHRGFAELLNRNIGFFNGRLRTQIPFKAKFIATAGKPPKPKRPPRKKARKEGVAPAADEY